MSGASDAARFKAMLNHTDSGVTQRHYLQEQNVEDRREKLWRVSKYYERKVTIYLDGSNKPNPCEGTLRELIYGREAEIFESNRPQMNPKEIIEAMR